MNIYRLLRWNRRIKNHRLKFLGLFVLHTFKQRYLAVNIDPVMACNLRCKMCYFTDPEYVRSIKGQFKEEELNRVAKVIFKRALKLQIGCGTEPTLYKDLHKLVALGTKYKVPYISITTNANLLDEEKIRILLNAGLDEFTISLHGVNQESYESFMQKASYEKFHEVFQTFKKLKSEFDFKVRINYTFNQDNFYELAEFFDHFDGDSFDLLQIRPIQKIGNTTYNNFDLSPLKEDYKTLISDIRDKCRQHMITLLASDEIPEPDSSNQSSLVFDYTFCYISPQKFWKPGFDWRSQDFESFSKEIGWGKLLLSNAFKPKDKLKSLSSRLNYEVEFN